MPETVKNCDVSARGIQVLFRSVIRSVNTVRWKEDSEDDYFEQKIGIKPHLSHWSFKVSL